MAKVNTVWMSPRVSVGFERIGREAKAVRLKGVVALGFGFNKSGRGWLDACPEVGLELEELARPLLALRNIPVGLFLQAW